MAPETEPTDEELHRVMSEALALAMDRKSISDTWMQQRLLDEVAQTLAQHGANSY